MRRTTLRTLAAAAAGLTLVAAGATATAATAGADGGSRDDAGRYSAGLLRAMQDDLGVSKARAVERLDFQADAAETQAALDKTLGKDFAGTWLDPQDDVVYVATTDAGDAAKVRRAGARAVEARWSLDRLQGWADDLEGALGDARGVPSWAVDVEENAIVVQVHRGAEKTARAAVRAAGVPRGAVTYAVTADEPRLLQDVVGGNAYYIGQGTRCSVGFVVTTGFVTAGHCGQTGATTSQPSGTFAGSSFPGNDYAYVRTAAGNTLVGAVNNYAGGQVAVAGATPVSVGAQVCRSGSTTGWHCGTVTALNSSVTYPEGTITGLIQTTVCAEPGDSGGSLLAGNQAQGVTSGGSGNCSSGGQTFFQPVGEILAAYGLTLVTSGGGDPEEPPPGSACTGTSHTATGSLYSGGQAVEPDGSYFSLNRSTTVRACVDGPAGADFDLYLQRWTGSTWATVAQGATPSDDETLSYAATSGYYRVVVHAYTGSGAYTVGISAA
ncbi:MULTISPECIES: S1 family peptidase [unclassified Isoptericola]|uniref:S1 family peptidase n=1 Tax=unclassified Isoptericola TaxID=2623355 RepID=UPI00365EA866